MTSPRETVVLLHGFAASNLVMWPLKARLARRGWATRFWSYSSLWQPIQRHAQSFRSFLDDLSHRGERFHIVAHSMGGVITRAALCDSLPPHLGRIVLIATPNRGLPAARRAPWYIKRVSQPMHQLADEPASFVNSLPTVENLEAAVIAGRFDFLVPAANTHVRGQRAHRTLPATHNSLLAMRRTAHLVHEFLAAGRFDDDDAAEASGEQPD